MVESIKNVLMQRDGLSEEDAQRQVEELHEEFFARISCGDMPCDLMEMVGLEPDYLEELIF